MKTFDIKVSRDGRWWMIEIPELDGLTQARRLAEVEEMATSYIAMETDLPASAVCVGEMHIQVGGEDVATEMGEIAELRTELKRMEQLVAQRMREMARRLAGSDVPVRDIGAALKVSHQRASQLLND